MCYISVYTPVKRNASLDYSTTYTLTKLSKYKDQVSSRFSQLVIQSARDSYIKIEKVRYKAK